MNVKKTKSSKKIVLKITMSMTAIHIIGADEFDFRFATIQPITGFKHFKDGVSKLKQVTG